MTPAAIEVFLMVWEKRPSFRLAGVGLLSLLAIAAPASAAATGSGENGWQRGFHINGLSNRAVASVLHDDGSGPALYFGGDIRAGDDVAVNSIVRWNGSQMSAVGAGLNGTAVAMTQFDSGDGPELYVGGDYTSAGGDDIPYLAKWDGSAWSAVGLGVDGPVYDLLVWNDGSGPALYVTGDFSFAGGVPAAGIARWNGSAWSALGGGGLGGEPGSGFCMITFDDGAGPALYVSGDFMMAGGNPAPRIAKWKNNVWTAVGAGFDIPAYRLATFDFGSGMQLVAGGYDLDSGGTTIEGVARWDGVAWSQVGAGLGFGRIYDFAVFDSGSGPRLYAAGQFQVSGPALLPGIARWEGSSWVALGSGVATLENVSNLIVVGAGSGPAAGLYLSGTFSRAGGMIADKLARWNGTQFFPVTGAPPGFGINGASVWSMAGHDPGQGGPLYVAGPFAGAGPVLASAVAVWNGQGWSEFGGGVHQSGAFSTTADEIEVFDDGAGPLEVFVSGQFDSAGGVPADGIARWNGTSWVGISTLGNRRVYDFAAVTIAGERQLVAAGTYFMPEVGWNLTSWDGAGWSNLGSPDDWVNAAVELDGDLYIGGYFRSVGPMGTVANGVARWDGTTWSAVGGGGTPGVIQDMAVYDAGEGPELYVSGDFTQIGGKTIHGLARWDGSEWWPVGDVQFEGDRIRTLAAFDDGYGLKLAIGGHYFGPLGPERHTLLFWDGETFSQPKGGEPGESVASLKFHDDGSGPALFVGGAFSAVGAIASESFAKYTLGLLFKDGFESGDTEGWTSANP